MHDEHGPEQLAEMTGRPRITLEEMRAALPPLPEDPQPSRDLVRHVKQAWIDDRRKAGYVHACTWLGPDQSAALERIKAHYGQDGISGGVRVAIELADPIAQAMSAGPAITAHPDIVAALSCSTYGEAATLALHWLWQQLQDGRVTADDVRLCAPPESKEQKPRIAKLPDVRGPIPAFGWTGGRKAAMTIRPGRTSGGDVPCR